MEDFSNAQWMPVIPLVASFYVTLLIHVGMMALAGTFFGIKFTEISIGQLIPLFSLPLPSFRLTLKAVPISGYVQFAKRDEADIPIGRELDQAAYFETLPTPAQIAIHLSGCIALFAIAYALLGDVTWRTGFSVWGQFFYGALSPFGLAQDYLAKSWAFVATVPTGMLFGTVFAKQAAFNLLPLASMNGGMVLVLLLGADLQGTAFKAYLHVSFLLFCLAMLSWLVAIVYAVL